MPGPPLGVSRFHHGCGLAEVGGVEGVSGFQGVVSVGGTQGVESVGPEGEGEGGLGLCGVVSVPGLVGGAVLGSKVVCGTET